MPPGSKKMVVGFNHNIKHAGRVYHVQTEDSGLDNPHVITHLFVGGNILASKKTSYADIVGADNLADVVRELMEEQHKEMLRNLINGVYDNVDATGPEGSRAWQPGQVQGGAAPRAAPPGPSRFPQRPAPGPPPSTRAPPPEVAAAQQSPPPALRDDGETLFGEDLISEKSLDEVILSYLAEDLGERKP
ncbi:MAG TPA: hypothetical protein VMK42_10345 [Anaeromyxobacteraceae bacterium]|nr:hypothetical protein [Anaeromyxobacteraceae bacterium]